ncbi:unnamed protein product [Spirodela intermedia]|uniref:Uncharacterized protein n=1 Tax=Spirodela intermedia TaxID=51605 RepID=A0A7I8JJP5_SPIIN|nr:unnamed protein product [Spirodela intermedia]CAA6670005.1 unnamed protein product [Spirodela intermedia]
MEGLSSSGVMGYAEGGGSSGLSQLMIMPLMASQPASAEHNLLFLPPPTNHHHGGQQEQPPPAEHRNDNVRYPLSYPAPMGEKDRSNMKAKIMCHPHYPRLLSAYVNCHKLGEDPALDQFMEEELSKPFKEAMLFLSRMESQFKSLSGRRVLREDADMAGEAYVDPQAEDRELKGQLLRKYSGYLGGLKQEFLKRRKKGKLPKEARYQLLDWWNRHYKWPYPSESQKLALAESTGLDQKQINNWFINQRKRHWKPAEEMQFVAAAAEAGRPHYYLDNPVGNPFSVGFASPFSEVQRPM